MHLSSDHVHPIPGPKGGRCRVRIFVPEEEGERLGDRPVVVCSEVAGNPGRSVTEAAEAIRAGVVQSFRLIDPIWIEHHPPSATDGRTETLELVVFAIPGGPHWKPLDRGSVETLVGARL